MASAADIAHQKHVAKLKSLGSRLVNVHNHTSSVEEEVEEPDPEEIAYRERLKTLAQESDEEVFDLNELAERRLSQSAQRAQDALRRTSSGATGIEWVAGEGEKLFVRSISSNNASDIPATSS